MYIHTYIHTYLSAPLERIAISIDHLNIRLFERHFRRNVARNSVHALSYHDAFVRGLRKIVGADRVFGHQHRISEAFHRLHTSAYVSIRQHTSAYVSIRQHNIIRSAARTRSVKVRCTQTTAYMSSYYHITTHNVS